MRGRDRSTHASKLQSCQHSPGNRLTMQKLAVTRDSLDGMADSVPEVQNHAQAGFSLVNSNDIGFHPYRCRDDIFQRLAVASKTCLGVALHEEKKARIANHACLNTFK